MEARITPICKVLALGAALLAASPALAQVAGPTPPEPTPVELDRFVASLAADGDGRPDLAAPAYAVALDRSPADTALAMRAYRQGLAAGDFALAARAAGLLIAANAAPFDAFVVTFAVALKAGNRAAAEAALTRMEGTPLDFMKPVLMAWMAQDRGATKTQTGAPPGPGRQWHRRCVPRQRSPGARAPPGRWPAHRPAAGAAAPRPDQGGYMLG